MSILKVRRVSLHPWIWWVIVRNAISGLQHRESLSPEGRRRIAAILQILDARLDPDDSVFDAPYIRLSRADIRERNERNAEIIVECNGDELAARHVKQRVDPQKGIVHGWRPIPNKDLRVVIDFPEADIKTLDSALDEYSRRSDVRHDFDQAIVDALDAITTAKLVEIDTERTGG